MNEKLAAPKPEEATTNKEVIAPWTGGGTQTALPGNFLAEPLPAPPTPWAPIVQQIHSHKPILACEKCGAESERQAKGLCFGEECPMTLRTGWIESLIQINIDTIAAGFYGDPALTESLSAVSLTCTCPETVWAADGSEMNDSTCKVCSDDGAVSPEPTKRTDKDYAIEHGGYLANSAEGYMEAINKYSAGEVDNDYLTDHWRALQSTVYEFRKRAKRAVSQSTAEEEGK